MIDNETFAQYRALRAEGMRASSALAYARSITSPDTSGLTWEGTDSYLVTDLKGTATIDGFDVTATVVEDYDYQPPGVFEDSRTDDYGRDVKPSEDAVRARGVHFWTQGTADWFTPEVTEADHYQGLLAAGYGKAQARDLARFYVQEDMRMAARPEAYGLVVKVSRAGVPLGEASVWGFDVDSDGSQERNRAMIINAFADHGLVEEALDEARARLAALVAS